MNRFFLILLHTFMTKLKTKSFIITTIVTMVALLGLTNLNRIIDMFNKDSGKEKIAVIDQSGQLFIPLKQQLRLVNKDVTLIEYKGTEQEAVRAVKKGKFNGFVHIGLNGEKLPEGSFTAMSIAGTGFSSDLKNSLQQLKSAMAASQINLTNVQLQKLYEPVAFKQTALEKNAKTEAELNQTRGLVYILLFIIYFAVIMYASMIAMEVATEKSSRVMEILISSVPPIQQMFAKILGVGLLSIAQLVLLLSISYFSFQRNMKQMKGGIAQFFGFNEIPVSTLVYAVIFFILGYFLYATLAAFLGSLVSRIEDVQQMITPMTMLILAGFMIAMFGLGKPDAPFITFTSYIPFFAPMIMFLRVGMLNIPFWEALTSMGILIVTILLLGVFGARVYRGGVLMYGKSNSYKDIKKALQLTRNK